MSSLNEVRNLIGLGIPDSEIAHESRFGKMHEAVQSLMYRQGQDLPALQKEKAKFQKEAIKKIYPSSQIKGAYDLEGGKTTMTLFNHNEYGVGALMTHSNGDHYAYFTHFDRLPPRGDAGSDWKYRRSMDSALRSAGNKVKRLIKYKIYRRSRPNQVDRETGEFRKVPRDSGVQQ